MSVTKLKPCPFCGVAMRAIKLDTGWQHGWRVVAAEVHRIMCYCEGDMGPFYANKAEMIAAWNRRAKP